MFTYIQGKKFRLSLTLAGKKIFPKRLTSCLILYSFYFEKKKPREKVDSQNQRMFPCLYKPRKTLCDRHNSIDTHKKGTTNNRNTTLIRGSA